MSERIVCHHGMAKAKGDHVAVATSPASSPTSTTSCSPRTRLLPSAVPAG